MIRSLCAVTDDYNPFAQIAYKIYRYHFCLEQPSPSRARYQFHVRKKINLDHLHTTLQLFVGTHDFRSFCTGNEYEDTVRTINSIGLQGPKRYTTYRIEIRGPGFLRYMIRRIVGASLAAAHNPSITDAQVREILERKNPCHPLPKAPAHGLVLHKVVYNK
jgi:tRNA pseudouridine38-40 synthase